MKEPGLGKTRNKYLFTFTKRSSLQDMSGYAWWGIIATLEDEWFHENTRIQTEPGSHPMVWNIQVMGNSGRACATRSNDPRGGGIESHSLLLFILLSFSLFCRQYVSFTSLKELSKIQNLAELPVTKQDLITTEGFEMFYHHISPKPNRANQRTATTAQQLDRKFKSSKRTFWLQKKRSRSRRQQILMTFTNPMDPIKSKIDQKGCFF